MNVAHFCIFVYHYVTQSALFIFSNELNRVVTASTLFNLPLIFGRFSMVAAKFTSCHCIHVTWELFMLLKRTFSIPLFFLSLFPFELEYLTSIILNSIFSHFRLDNTLHHTSQLLTYYLSLLLCLLRTCVLNAK